MNLYYSVYAFGSKLIIPTSARTEAGFVMEIEPVWVVPDDDLEAVSDALSEVFARGNPVIPTPTGRNYPPAVVLKYAGVKSWSAFARKANAWMIEQVDYGYEVCPLKRDGPGFTSDQDRAVTVDAGESTVATAKRIGEVLASSRR